MSFVSNLSLLLFFISHLKSLRISVSRGQIIDKNIKAYIDKDLLISINKKKSLFEVSMGIFVRHLIPYRKKNVSIEWL
jgi:hypothetical protein